MGSETFTPEQEETVERIETQLRELSATLRILVWSKTGVWPEKDVQVDGAT